MGLRAGGLGGWTREMEWGEAALLATGGPGSGCGVGSFREMVSTALRGVGVLASGDRRGLKPITELGWGAGGAVGGCVRDMRWGGRVLLFWGWGLSCCSWDMISWSCCLVVVGEDDSFFPGPSVGGEMMKLMGPFFFFFHFLKCSP